MLQDGRQHAKSRGCWGRDGGVSPRLLLFGMGGLGNRATDGKEQ